jgi:hypothetical protein
VESSVWPLRTSNDIAEKDRELALVVGELAEARYELARRDTAAAFANAPSPSTSLH